MSIIRIVLEDEHGTPLEEVEGDTVALGSVLAAAPVEGTSCLRFLDPYGDAVFNQLQAPVLRRELEAIRATPEARPVSSVIDEVLALVTKCEARPHTYLRFFGD